MRKRNMHQHFSVPGGIFFLLGILGSRALENAWISSWLRDLISNQAVYNAFNGFAQGLSVVFLAASIYLNIKTLMLSMRSAEI